MFQIMVVSKQTLGAVLAPDGLTNSRLVDLFAASLRVDFCNKLKSAFNNVIMLYKTDKKFINYCRLEMIACASVGWLPFGVVLPYLESPLGFARLM